MPYRALTLLIDRHFEALSPELQRAARWVREHPAELGLQSLRASARAAGVAMVFQHFSLFEALNVAENVALGMENPPRLRELASLYGVMDLLQPV